MSFNDMSQRLKQASSSLRTSQPATPSKMNDPRVVQKMRNNFSRFQRNNSPASSVDTSVGTSFQRLRQREETPLQRLLYQEETPVQKNWYAGEQPTGNETLARIYDISQSDTEQGQALYATYGQYMNDPSSPYFAPYNQPTSYAAQELAKLGYGTENGVDDQWFEEYGYLKNYYRTGTSGNPLAPTSKSSKEEQAAYWYYQLLDDHEATKRIDAEKAALTEEITYWAQRSDLNLSYDEIINDYIDWSKYPEYASAEKKRQDGLAKQYTHSVYFNNDYLQGVYWAAHNDGGSGNEIINGVNYARGVGNVYVADPKISAKLNPGSEDYHPYVFGTTLNDAAVYFGVSHFPPGWTDANRADILGGTDETAKKNFYAVEVAEETTLKAEEEYAALMGWVDWQIANHPGDPSWLDEGLPSDYTTLKRMDEGRFNGNVVGLTRSVDYRWEDVEAYARQRYAEYEAAPVLSAYVRGVTETLGLQPAVTAQSQQGIDANRDEILHMAAPTLAEVGNEAEQRVFSTLGVSRFNDYAGLLSDAINSGYIQLPTESTGLYSTADAYAAENYTSAVQVLAPYREAVANRDAAQAELDALKSIGLERELTEEEAIRAEALQRTIDDSNATINLLQPDYDTALYLEQETSSRYDMTGRLAGALGLETPEGYVPMYKLIDEAYRLGGKYETPWAQYTALDVAMTNGASYEEVAAYARNDIVKAQEEINTCESLRDEIVDRGGWIPQEWSQNLQWRQEKRQRDIKDSEYFLLRGKEGFSETAKAETDKVLASDKYSNEYSGLTREIAGIEPYYLTYTLGYVQEQTHNVAEMTDAEKETYMYLVATQGEDAAKEFYKHLIDPAYGVIPVRQGTKIMESTEQLTRDSFVGANLLGTMASLVSFQGLGYIGLATITGQRINPYNPALAMNQISSTVNSTSVEMINETFEDSPVLANVLSFGYNALSSMANSITSGVVYGPLSPTMMAVNAAVGTTADASANGANTFEALALGSIAALAEYWTEKISFGDMEKTFTTSPTTVREFIATAGGNAAKEGATDAFSSLITTVSDTEIMGEASAWSRNRKAYMAGGMLSEDAWWSATFDMIYNIAYEGLVGAVAGGGQTVVSALGGLLKNRGKTNAPAEVAADTPAEGEAVTPAEPEYGLRHGHTRQDSTATAPSQAQLSADRGNEPNPNQNLAVSEPAPNADTAANAENASADAEALDVADAENASDESAPAAEAVASDASEGQSAPTPRRAAARPIARDVGEQSQPTYPAHPSGAQFVVPSTSDPQADDARFVPRDIESRPNAAAVQRQLRTIWAFCDAVEASPRRENKAAAVSALLNRRGSGDRNAQAVANAATARLFDKYGADKAVQAVKAFFTHGSDLRTPVDIETLSSAMITAALGEGSAARQFDIFMRFPDYRSIAVVESVCDMARNDWDNPRVMSKINQEAFETRVAQREMALVSEGALDGIKAYETAYKQARANLATAQQNLETAQAELETAGQNLVTVQSQWVEEPSNAMRQGAVQQATKDVEGKVIVRNQQEQSVAKYEAQKAEAESMLKAQRERAMKPIREQAQQEVAAEVEAENQQKAEREAAAEQKRQSDNTQALDADAFIEARYPNASEEQKQKIRETFAQTAQKKPAEVSKDNYAFASALAKRFGVKVTFTDSKGAYEGAYTPDGEILLDRNATQGDAIRRIMLHELAHRAEEGKSYNKLADALLATVYNGDESAMNADKQSIARRYSAKNLNESGLRAELVADAAGKLLDNEATIQRFVDANPISARSFWEWLKSVVNRLRGVNDPEADRIRKAEKLFEKALKEAEKKARKTLKQHGVEIIKGSATKYSLTSWTEAEQAAVRKALLKAGYDVDAADRWIDDVTSMAAVIAEDPERLDFTPAEQHKMLKKNQEYRFTLDSSTLCAKRILYQGTFNAIQRALANTPLMSDDMIDLRVLMANMGYETPCAVCYVESRRRFLGKFAQEWIESYTGDYMPTIADVTTTDGLERMRVEHPEVYESYVTAMKKKGSANPKIIELRTDYRGDIRKITKRTVDYLNRIGGLRIQSFSDFETPHLLDMMQAVLDMASKKLMSQAYTKVPNFAAVFGGTGIKINLSLLSEGTGLDADGNLTFSSYEGMDFDRAMELRNQYSQNVGTILVGLNDAHILKALADPRIDFVIPYHKSGWSAETMGRLLPGQPTPTDYTAEQNERRIKGYTKEGKPIYENAGGNFYPGDYWDFSKTGKENAEIYLRKCAEDGRIPKFDRFLHDNGDGSYSLPEDGSADGYWKLLIDFKMYDNDGNPAPQQEVKPNFNMEEARRVLNSYEGGANTLPVAWDVVDAYVKQYKEKHPGVKYSLPALPSDGNLEREVEAWLQQNAPDAPVDTTGLKERQSTTKTMQESPLIPGWSKGGMLKDPRQRYYEADTNAAQEQRSWNRYLNEGYEAMRDRILDVSVPTADDITDSLLIMAIAEKNNDVATFMDMALWYEVQGGTTIGQAMQARQRISKMTPSGMRAWVTGKAEADLKGYLLNHQPAAKRVRKAAKETEAEIRNLDKTSTAEALSAEGDIVVTNNRWHMPVNEQQMALIKKYNLEKVSRPGAHYNRATIKQRMLEAILTTSDPEAVTGLGLNLIERLELMKHKQAVLTEADIDYVVDNMERYAADPDTRAGAIALARAHEAFANITPATGLQKRRAWRYTSMLLSLPTAERNVIGNVTMAGVTAASDSVAVILDNIISKKTGTRTRANLTLQERADGWYAFVDETVNTFRDFAFDKVNTTPSQDRYDTKALGRVFQNPLLEGMRNIEGLLMSVGDRGFWKRAFVNSIAEQQRVASMNNQEFNEEAAIQQAIEDANYATFAEDGRVMVAFNAIRNHPYFADIFDFVMPFTKVPANITKRMFQYSPFGLAWCGIKYVGRHLAHVNFDQRAFVTEMSRALTGSAMFTIGMALASVGFIKLGTGEEEDKKVAGVQSARGDQYSAYVEIGGQNFSLDTFMPAATPFVMGAAAYDAVQNDENFWAALFNAGVAAMGQIYNASFMSGLRDIFGGYGSVPENFINVVYTNAIAQNVPAILGQIATTIDPYVRDTKDSNSLMQALKAGLIQRIPGLRELLPEKVDVAGQTVPSKHWASLIDPFTRTVASDDPVFDELLRLTDVMRSKGLNDSAHLPSDALSGSKNTLSGVAQPLSDADKEAYKKRYGDLWLNGTGEGVTYDSNGNEVKFMGVRELIQSDHYQGLSDIDKAEAISGIMSAAKTGATYEMGMELGFKKSEPVEEPTIKAYRAVPVQMKGIMHYDKLEEAYNRTGNGGFIPKGIGRTFTIDGVSTTLNDEEYEILWGLYLNEVNMCMAKIEKSDWSLPDDELIAKLDGVWSAAGRKARDNYKKYHHKGE